MSHTYSQIYIHVVFAVRNRKALILPEWEEELYKYITGIVQNRGQKMIAINGVANHIHFFIGMKPSCCLSDLVREIKKSSNGYINENKFTKEIFHWQEGFGAFSYSYSHIPNVARYIENQKQHHQQITFRKEYIETLQAFDVDYEEDYLFDWIEEE